MAPSPPAKERKSSTDNYQPPRFIIPLEVNKAVDEAQPITLLCKLLEGNPKPRLTWFKNQLPLPASTRSTTAFDMTTGVVSLKISDAQLNDTAVYSVRAENECGGDQTACQVLVKPTPNIDRTSMVNPQAFKYLDRPSDSIPSTKAGGGLNSERLVPPKVVVPLANVKLEEGKSALLVCKITGEPKPRITWLKDDVPLPAATRYTLHHELPTDVVSLRIDNVQMNDLGTYQVIADNPAGRDHTVGSLFVQQMPGVDRTPIVNPDAFRYLDQHPGVKERKPSLGEPGEPPRVIVPLQDIGVKESEPVLLMCKIIGNPKPKVRY